MTIDRAEKALRAAEVAWQKEWARNGQMTVAGEAFVVAMKAARASLEDSPARPIRSVTDPA